MTIYSASTNDKNRPIAVFYHVFQGQNWRELFAYQTNLIESSGLLNVVEFVHVGVNGSEGISAPNDKYRIYYNEQPWTEETPTLQSLNQFADANPGWRVLYLHTKGITQPIPATRDWRMVMEYFCIERWSGCLQALEENDAVGCLYMDDCYYGYFPHFSGNFWWATTDYISRLDDSFLTSGIRQNREFWIGTGNGKLFSFHTTGLNHYAHEYPRSLYAS